jgi:hypothetical protein
VKKVGNFGHSIVMYGRSFTRLRSWYMLSVVCADDSSQLRSDVCSLQMILHSWDLMSVVCRWFFTVERSVVCCLKMISWITKNQIWWCWFSSQCLLKLWRYEVMIHKYQLLIFALGEVNWASYPDLKICAQCMDWCIMSSCIFIVFCHKSHGTTHVFCRQGQGFSKLQWTRDLLSF